MRRKRKNSWFSARNLMAGFIVLIMVLSVLGFMWGRGAEDQGSLRYNDIPFNRLSSGWQADIDEVTYQFYYFPGEVDRIGMDPADAALLRDARMTVFLFDPDDDELPTLDTLRLDLTETLADGFDSYMAGAVSETSETYALEVMGCANASQYIPFIYFTKGNETAITRSPANPYCLMLTAGSGVGYVELKDRLLYGMLGVIP